MPAEPYLTVVAASRNDDHGGDMLRRMQVFIDALAAQCARHDVAVELLLVEWNPPADRPSLRDALTWPVAGGRLEVRIVQVPPALHVTLENADRLAFFQMIAKNVGIRRARAPFVLATNIDIVFPDELFRLVARRRFRSGRFYRADRHDVELGAAPPAQVDALLAACRACVIRISTRRGTRDLRTGDWYPIYASPRNIPVLAFAYVRRRALAAARLLRLALWRQPGDASWARDLVERRVQATSEHARERGAVRAAGRLILGPLLHRVRVVAHLLRPVRPRLYTNASGDFTLLERDDWARLRGYPELPIFSMHIDSLLLYQAHFAGLKEVALPYPVFHLEHEKGFKPDGEGQRKMNEWVERAGIPQITDEQFGKWVAEMEQRRGPLQFNSEGWGFGAAELPEESFAV